MVLATFFELFLRHLQDIQGLVFGSDSQSEGLFGGFFYIFLLVQ